MSQPEGQPVENTGDNKPEGQASETHNDNHDNLTPEQLRAELSKVRQEAASRRVALREAEEKAKKWSEYEESQKTELQKLQDQLATKDKAIADKELEVSRSKIAKKFNVADEDVDLLVGDEENMERLAKRLGLQEAPKGNPDLYAGNRGKPVGDSSNSDSMEAFIRGSAKKY